MKSVVTYGKHWVRQQARMSSTSNQEVFRAYMEGRLVIDMLRVVLVSFNLSTFTLAECSQVNLFITSVLRFRLFVSTVLFECYFSLLKFEDHRLAFTQALAGKFKEI